MSNFKFNAIGIVEISFYSNALLVLDEMLKASEVKLVHWEKLLGGRLVSIIIGGETSAVQSAIDMALDVGDKVGEKNIKLAIAIPSPHPQILKLFYKKQQEQIQEVSESKSNQQEQIQEIHESEIEQEKPQSKLNSRRKKK